MKKLVLAAITLTAAASVFAQGTVIFNNRVTGAGTTHVWGGGTHQIQGNAPTGDTTAGTADYSGLTLVGTGGLTGLYGASTTWTALLGAPGQNAAESALLQGSPTTTFRTGAGAGNVAGATSTFNNIPPDNATGGSFEMVAWDNTSGLYSTWALASVAWLQGRIAAGRSLEFNLASVGGTGTPPNMVPAAQSFNIFVIPEPSTFALAGLGAAVLMIFRRRK